MDLKHIINIVWRRIWVIILAVIATMVIAVLGTHFTTPIYQSSTTLRIATSAGSQLNYSDYVNADRLMNTYIEIAASKPARAAL